MNKLVFAAIAAAILAGIAVVVPGMTVKVEASAARVGKGDRLDIKTSYGTACSQRGWPHFETSCLRNLTSPVREAKTVRVVTTDRLMVEDRSLVMAGR
jgi:hypothetical protein